MGMSLGPPPKVVVPEVVDEIDFERFTNQQLDEYIWDGKLPEYYAMVKVAKIIGQAVMPQIMQGEES